MLCISSYRAVTRNFIPLRHTQNFCKSALKFFLAILSHPSTLIYSYLAIKVRWSSSLRTVAVFLPLSLIICKRCDESVISELVVHERQPFGIPQRSPIDISVARHCFHG